MIAYHDRLSHDVRCPVDDSCPFKAVLVPLLQLGEVDVLAGLKMIRNACLEAPPNRSAGNVGFLDLSEKWVL